MGMKMVLRSNLVDGPRTRAGSIEHGPAVTQITIELSLNGSAPRPGIGDRCDHGSMTGFSDGAAVSDAPPSTLYLIKRLELAVRALMDDALRPLGLTTLQYTALTVLERRSGLSSAQLARRSFLRAQTMNVMVKTLEERGLIQRHPDPANRRVLVAALTERGREVLSEAEPLVAVIESRLMDGMSERRGEEFRSLLRQGVGALANEAERRRIAESSGD
ncbi:MarR family winged helix-turn-helix transcriptional regulator [Nocardia rhizosphaerihabitans]|uniref:MarR family winged helix-turn-helix transcriptional regulator n=1 Tax=Nocardia rhizosphaerihabitans TaxID=1691570 RepID=UPI00366ECBBE